MTSVVAVSDTCQSEQETYSMQLLCPGGFLDIILKNASLTDLANERLASGVSSALFDPPLAPCLLSPFKLHGTIEHIPCYRFERGKV